MRIGVIGASTVGWTLATKFAARHQVLIANSRGPESLARQIADAGLPIKVVRTSNLAECDLILLAVPWTKIPDALSPDLSLAAKVLVDATNIFLSYAPEFRVDDLRGESGSEIVARLVPGAHVVKAFNTLPFAKMFDRLPTPNFRRVLFVAGDNSEALAVVADLIRDIDLIPVLLGSLGVAGRLMEIGGPLSGLELFAATLQSPAS
jgi:predicted dinucleotide-binding enzyme